MNSPTHTWPYVVRRHGCKPGWNEVASGLGLVSGLGLGLGSGLGLGLALHDLGLDPLLTQFVLFRLGLMMSFGLRLGLG